MKRSVKISNKALIFASCPDGQYFVRKMVKQYSKDGESVVITRKMLTDAITEFQEYHRKCRLKQIKEGIIYWDSMENVRYFLSKFANMSIFYYNVNKMIDAFFTNLKDKKEYYTW